MAWLMKTWRLLENQQIANDKPALGNMLFL
jgi:hypothetical protein